MNRQLRPPAHHHRVRAVGALGAALALTLAACGGSDASDATVADTVGAGTTQPATTEIGDGEPTSSPASIVADAQTSDGATIVIASVELPSPGFVAVHGDGGGSPGAVIGHSDLLARGASTNVSITLDERLTAAGTLYPMVHIDIDSDGVYEFGGDDNTDTPALTAAGDVAVVPVEITLADSGSAAPETDAGNAITIANFSFSGVTEVPVGTTVVVTNTDSTQHTWSAVDGTFDSGAIGEGETFEFTFTEPGSFDYFCNFHPSMTGTIVVTA